jgi:LmbE family N-acetylglucosaminyl deacetylase
MITADLGLPAGSAPRILLLGAHCDDIEIGCGGTLQVLAALYPRGEFRWSVFSSTEERAEETRRAAAMLLPDTVRVQFDIQRFRNSYFPYVGAAVKDHMETIKREFAPDLILTHFEKDRHQDHRVVSELTRNAYRDHLILEYEIVKYDGDLESPNVFVPLTGEQVEKKIDALMTAFPSQRGHHWFTPDTFKALLRVRGIEANAPSGFAEGFHCRKLRLLA